MNPILTHSIIYIVCFFLVWLGAGLAVSAVSALAKSWRLPEFTVSFFLLGILTSLPEITIGSIALYQQDYAIFVGNLLGGVVVIFLGVIPLLGMLSGGIKIPKLLNKQELLFTLLVTITPAILTADQKITQWEGVAMIVLYTSLFVFLTFEQSLFQKMKQKMKQKRSHHWTILGKILFGMAILIAASHQIVATTEYFATVFHISPFFISLVIVSIGTNIPELSIVFRSVLSGKTDIALADYLGSACANTLLFGIFTVLAGETISLPNHFLQRFVFLILGMVMFFLFARSKNTLSRTESAALFMVYIAFLAFEILFITS